MANGRRAVVHQRRDGFRSQGCYRGSGDRRGTVRGTRRNRRDVSRIGNIPFTVIGVLDKKGLGSAGRSQDDIVFIPLSTAKSRVLGAVRGTTREALDFISIKVSDATVMPTVSNEIETLLRQRHRTSRDAASDFR